MTYIKLQKTIALIALSVSLIACGTSESKIEDSYVETEYDIKIGQYLEGKDWNTERSETGLYSFIEEKGSLEKPTINDFVTIKYTAILLNGVVFDETGSEPVKFPFPISELIPGWQEALQNLGKGGKGKFIIPPHLAFGDQVSGPIPANSVITIDIELIDFQPTPPEQELPVALEDYTEVIEKYIADNNIEGMVKTKEGIYIQVGNEGSKEKPTLSNEVTIHYKGYLLDHTIFDQTDDETRTFPLGGLIAGWKIGIPYIGKGGKCKLIIPPHLGYGPNSSDPIPPNSILVFDIELEDFK